MRPWAEPGVLAVEGSKHRRFAFAALDRVGHHVDQDLDTQDVAQQDEFLAVVIAKLARTRQVVASGQEFAVLQLHVLDEAVQVLDQRCHDFALARRHVPVLAEAADHHVGDVVLVNDAHGVLLRTGCFDVVSGRRGLTV